MIPIQYALRRRMMMAAMASVDVSALSITYTGAYTDYGMVTMSDGARYRLLAFTASGTLSIEQPVNCEVCVVGGGANGGSTDGYDSNGGFGGAGAYLKNQSVSAYNGGSVVVGAGQGVSSIADVSVNAVSGRNGGTGAGGYVAGTGDGISKYPFEDTGYSLWAGKPHCAGGGGGGKYRQRGADRYDSKKGGDGGTNGGNGGIDTNNGSHPGGSGGAYGGGSGGNGGTHLSEQGAGKSAAYYGSGGGGAGLYNVTGAKYGFTGGSGYQGIIYIRIPEDQAACGAPISDLPLGALINVGTDSGAGTPNYEIADKDNLVSGGVVLVRKNIYSKSQFGSNTNYPSGTLDNLIKPTIYNKMPQRLRDKMMDVSFNLSGSGDITRKMFALTYTMAGFGDNGDVTEGKALQLYTSDDSRKKTFNGSASSWWLSSRYSSDYIRFVAGGGAVQLFGPSNESGVVPAFVIPSKTPYDPTPNTDGSYNLIL